MMKLAVLKTVDQVIAAAKNGSAIPAPVLQLILPFNFSSMYELGNKKSGEITYKSVFVSLGIDHYSIDINGLDGAVSLDLRKKNDLPARDMVTNIGTSEHVHPHQEMCFRNIHNLSSRRMVHWVPYARTMPYHAIYGYELGFFEELAALNAYAIDKLYIQSRGIAFVACAAFRKTNSDEFKWKNFDTLLTKKRVEGKWRWI